MQTSHTFGIALLWKNPVDVKSRVGAIPCKNPDAVRDGVVNNTGHPVVRNNNNDHHHHPTTASVVVDVVVNVVDDDSRDYTTANNPIDRAVG